jgi:hypothetical protein
MAGLTRPLLRSFAGGEITPELYGRLDLDKFQTGLAKALNFIVLPHGPATNRPGLSFVNEVRDSTKKTRLIPFAYSADQTMVLEFSDQKIRFHTQGATLLGAFQSITGITNATPGVVTTSAALGVAPGDLVFINDVLGMTAVNGRYWKVSTVVGSTFVLVDPFTGIGFDTSALPAYASGGTAWRVLEIATPYAEADLPDIHYTQSADVLTLVHPSYAPRELRRLGATNWQLSTIAFGPSISAPGVPTIATGGPGGGTPTTKRYKTTATSSSNFEESLPSGAGTANIDLTVTGNFVDVTPAAVAGASRYTIYKQANGGLYGYVGQSDGSAFRDDNIIPDMSQTPPEGVALFGSSSNYPSAVTYIEQRRCFAATNNDPQKTWMSRSATESNFVQSVPVRDDDAIIFSVKANQQNRIRHLVPLGDLIALTAGGEFRIYAANSDVLTPASVTPKPQSYVGANNVQPAVAEASILYAQAQGGHMREFAYAGDGLNGATYKTNDISILAPHLFDGYTIVDLAYSRTAAHPILWAVRSDGLLLGMTYVPGQNVRAWHQHTTDGGVFESVCCVTEGDEDVLYAIVRRTVDGRSVRYVERMHTRQFSSQADAYFVDCGATYSGAATTTISGLHHLKGKTVSALADGAVVLGLTVSAAGTVTLPAAASKVHVGLPITAEMRTLPLSWQADGFGQGLIKNISKAHLRVASSGAYSVGPTDGTLREVKRRTTEPYGTPPAIKTGWDHMAVNPLWQDDGGVTVQHTYPLPLTVLSMVLETTSGG